MVGPAGRRRQRPCGAARSLPWGTANVAPQEKPRRSPRMTRRWCGYGRHYSLSMAASECRSIPPPTRSVQDAGYLASSWSRPAHLAARPGLGLWGQQRLLQGPLVSFTCKVEFCFSSVPVQRAGHQQLELIDDPICAWSRSIW